MDVNTVLSARLGALVAGGVRADGSRVINFACWLWRAVIGVVLLAAIVGTACASDGSRIAFVVGNANYVEATALKNPINDAAAMVSLFQRSGFMVEEINDLKTTEVATLRQKIEQIDRGSVVFFYYAGHGVQLDGRNYLLPVDVPTNRPDSMTDASVAFPQT